MKRSLVLICLGLSVACTQTIAQNTADENSAKVAGYLLDSHKNDKSFKRTVLKFQFGLAWEQIPAITNSASSDGTFNPYSTYDALSFPAVTSALEFRYNPARFLSLRLKPSSTYGASIGSGASGSYFDYSAEAKLMLGTRVKLFASAAYISRIGSYTLDFDQEAASLGISSSTGLTTTGTFAYSATRLGGGLYFETSQTSDSYVELGAFTESTSLSGNGTAVNNHVPSNPMVFRATAVFGKFFLEGSYSPNYPLDGSPLYDLDSNGAAQKSFLEIKMGAVFTL